MVRAVRPSDRLTTLAVQLLLLFVLLLECCGTGIEIWYLRPLDTDPHGHGYVRAAISTLYESTGMQMGTSSYIGSVTPSAAAQPSKASTQRATKMRLHNSASGTPGQLCKPMPPGCHALTLRRLARPAIGHEDASSTAAAEGPSPTGGATHRRGSNRSGSGCSEAIRLAMRASAVTTVPASTSYPAIEICSEATRNPPPAGGRSLKDSRSTPFVNGRFHCSHSAPAAVSPSAGTAAPAESAVA
mmetsp:Transcript_34350/g.94678  ORF Transcript_34350/g.94678 Transcript_34350/m.94678 type:complete len:243 (-) Transcript_34350:211-939(-)